MGSAIVEERRVLATGIHAADLGDAVERLADVLDVRESLGPVFGDPDERVVVGAQRLLDPPRRRFPVARRERIRVEDLVELGVDACESVRTAARSREGERERERERERARLLMCPLSGALFFVRIGSDASQLG